MSSLTASVAVAVSASTRGRPEPRQRRADLEERGPEIVPHCEMQCASSMTKRPISIAARRSRNSVSASRSGVVKTIFASPRAIACFGGVDVRGGERAVELPGRDAELAQLVVLVLHQRDQRRDDDRGAGQQQRRQLVAERLAGAGRHHRERRIAAHDAGDDRVLALAQSLEAERLAKERGERGAPRGGRPGRGAPREKMKACAARASGVPSDNARIERLPWRLNRSTARRCSPRRS
jgi:hypothetical protein